ncbi:unnamed protein product [Orchesella dallaii]|uniref:Uncharacterized protein n=1 Tax=Orchesella dallaii TaxID=48710 RepID=A0ABP1S7D7_9HEXA
MSAKQGKTIRTPTKQAPILSPNNSMELGDLFNSDISANSFSTQNGSRSNYGVPVNQAPTSIGASAINPQTLYTPLSTTIETNTPTAWFSGAITNCIEAALDKKLENLNKIDEIETLLRDSVQDHSDRLSELELQNKALQEEKTKLQSKVEHLESGHEIMLRELREKNLMICNLSDDKNESQEQLYQLLCSMFQELTGFNIIPDTCYRIGRFLAGKNRPIRAKFICIQDELRVFESRDKVEAPTYICEDIPFVTRRANAILRQKQEELEQAGSTCIVDLKKRTLKSSNGTVYTVKDGVLTSNDKTLTNPTPMTSNSIRPPLTNIPEKPVNTRSPSITNPQATANRPGPSNSNTYKQHKENNERSVRAIKRQRLGNKNAFLEETLTSVINQHQSQTEKNVTQSKTGVRTRSSSK